MSGAADYDERLGVPLRWWVQGVMLIASFWLAMVVAMPFAWACGFTVLMLVLLTVWFLAYGSARITVAAGTLRAGRAHIEARHLAGAEALDADATRRVAGVEADARAYLLLRPYLKRSVRVRLADPADPTPYWLLSTRHPDRLAAAVRASTVPR